MHRQTRKRRIAAWSKSAKSLGVYRAHSAKCFHREHAIRAERNEPRERSPARSRQEQRRSLASLASADTDFRSWAQAAAKLRLPERGDSVSWHFQSLERNRGPSRVLP